MAGFAPTLVSACRVATPGFPLLSDKHWRFPRRTPISCSMRRRDHPSRPNAMTFCFSASLKTLLMPDEGKAFPPE
jgi:hypothetical protein